MLSVIVVYILDDIIISMIIPLFYYIIYKIDDLKVC